MRHLPNTSTGCFRLALFGKPRHWGRSECASLIGCFVDSSSDVETSRKRPCDVAREILLNIIHTHRFKIRKKQLSNLFPPLVICVVTKCHVLVIMSKATSEELALYQRNRTVLSFRERYRLTVFVSTGTVAVMAQRGVSLKSVLTCYEKNKMIFFFIWAVIDFLTINISWFLLNIKQHPSPISRKPQTVLNVWMAWIVCIVLFSYHKCACPMSRAIAATFWPRGRRALRARRPRGPNVKKN